VPGSNIFSICVNIYKNLFSFKEGLGSKEGLVTILLVQVKDPIISISEIKIVS